MRDGLMAISLFFADHEQPLLCSSVLAESGHRGGKKHRREYCPGRCHSVTGFGSFFAFAGIESTGIFASNTKLKKPTIISSQLWSPQMTSFLGSGLYRLLGELSKCAVQRIFVPLGSTSGFSSVYQSCHAKL